jgi:hypothetical protein
MNCVFRSIPIDDWPWRDRETWALACQPSQRFLRGGAASHLKQVTRTSLIRAYGYLLDHRQRIGTLDLDAAPARHVNRESIESFLQELQDRVGSVTRYNYIARIHRIVTILAPETDWEWLKLIAQDLQDAQRPRSKAARIVSAERLLNLGIDLMQRARQEQDATPLQRAGVSQWPDNCAPGTIPDPAEEPGQPDHRSPASANRRYLVAHFGRR